MIYVDELKNNGWRLRGRDTLNCHLLTDGELEELHIFANKIGMKREWFQDKKYPHYDLTPKRRRSAIEHGAIEITTKEWLKKERAILVMNIINESVLEILAPKFSNIEKEILDKIDGEAFASGGIIYPPPNIISASNQPCSLTLKDLEKVWKKLNDSIPKHKLFYENVVNETEIEILLPDAVDIKRDKNRKVLSFMCWGVHFTATKYIPKGTIYSFNPEAAGIVWPKKKEE